MGFFSSRKAEDNDQYLTTTATTAEHNDSNKSVVHVIRSRFVRSCSIFFNLQSGGNLVLYGFTCSTARTKGKSARINHAPHLVRRMAVPWRRPSQSPHPRLQSEVPPPQLRRVHFLAAAAGLPDLVFCAHLTILSRLGFRQQVMVQAPLRLHPRLGPGINPLHLLASLQIMSRTSAASVFCHA
jgi:hypothetical protein